MRRGSFSFLILTSIVIIFLTLTTYLYISKELSVAIEEVDRDVVPILGIARIILCLNKSYTVEYIGPYRIQWESSGEHFIVELSREDLPVNYTIYIKKERLNCNSLYQNSTSL